MRNVALRLSKMRSDYRRCSDTQGTMDIDKSLQTEVVLPSGVRYTELRVGGGQIPPKGYLVSFLTISTGFKARYWGQGLAKCCLIYLLLTLMVEGVLHVPCFIDELAA